LDGRLPRAAALELLDPASSWVPLNYSKPCVGSIFSLSTNPNGGEARGEVALVKFIDGEKWSPFQDAATLDQVGENWL
jgi:hypothetical protein